MLANPPDAPSHRVPSRGARLAAAGLFSVLLTMSARLLLSALHRHVLWTDESPLLYHAATVSFNYVDFGFIRRGLGGTIVWLLGPDRLLATALFHLLSAAGIAAAAAWFYVRLPASATRRLIFALLLLALMGRWGEDPGRTDLCVAALLGGAAIAFETRRHVLACASVALALAVHENGLVFGVPLLLALLLDARRRGPLPRRQMALGAAVLGAAVTIYLLLPALPHAGREVMVAIVRSRLPLHEYVDWAIYFAVGGSRGVATSVCQNLGDPTYVLHIVSGLLVIVVFDVSLRTGRHPSRTAILAASVPPFLFLCAVANDMSRWTVLAAFNVWLVHAVAAIDAGPSSPRSRTARTRWATVVAAALVIPLLHSKTWRIDDPIFSPIPVLDRAVRELGGPTTPRFATALQRCDPQWRSVLNAPPPRAR